MKYMKCLKIAFALIFLVSLNYAATGDIIDQSGIALQRIGLEQLSTNVLYDLDGKNRLIGNDSGSVGVFEYASYDIDSLYICDIIISAGVGGSVNPSGVQSDTCGDTLGIRATPVSGYVFDRWVRTANIGITDSTSDTTNVWSADSNNGTVTAYFTSNVSIDTITPLKGKRGTIFKFEVTNLPDSASGVFAKINNVTLDSLIMWSSDSVHSRVPGWTPRGTYTRPWIGRWDGVDTLRYDTSTTPFRCYVPLIINGGN